MSMFINTNVMSISSQRALGQAQDMQATAMERLSSGKRINGAKDDAAGLAIAENFTSQIRGLSQSVKNAEQASSLAGTAEGALSEVADILQRMRELTVQASNSTLQTSNRTAIKSEIDTLTAEINRIANDTVYNGQKLLNGSASNLQFQVGQDVDSTIKFTIGNATAAGLGVGAGGFGGAADGIMFNKVVKTTLPTLDVDDIYINGKNWAGVVDAGSVTHLVNGVTTSTTLDFDDTSAAYHMALAINSATHEHGVEASAQTVIEGTTAGGVTTGNFTITVGGEVSTIRATTGMDDLVSAINAAVDADVTASLNDAGGLRIVDNLGRTVVTANNTLATVGIAAGTVEGHLILKSVDGSAFTIAAGSDVNNDTDQSQIDAAGLMVGTYGGGDDGQTYEIVGKQIITGTAITAANDFTINGVQIGSTDPLVAAANISASDLAAAVNAVAAESGVTAQASNELFLQIDTHATIDGASLAQSGDTITINGTSVDYGINNATFAQIVTAINTAMAANGDVRATLVDSNNGTIKLTSASGVNFSIADDDITDIILSVRRADGDNLQDDGSTATAPGSTAVEYTGKLTFRSTSGPIVFGAANGDTTVEQGTANAIGEVLGVAIAGDTNSAAGGSSSGVSVTSAAGAAASIGSIDSAIEKVADLRGGLGALQNRLAHTVSNLQTAIENHSNSRSLIEDADYAIESATLARSQVLAQAGTAMLAQANAAPQLALQLLQ